MKNTGRLCLKCDYRESFCTCAEPEFEERFDRKEALRALFEVMKNDRTLFTSRRVGLRELQAINDARLAGKAAATGTPKTEIDAFFQLTSKRGEL